MNSFVKPWFIVVAALAAASAGCNGGGGDDDDDTNTDPLNVSIGQYYSISGTSAVEPGECWGVTFTADPGSFDDSTELMPVDDNGDPTLFFGGNPNNPVILTEQSNTGDPLPILQVNDDGSELTIGFGDAYPCFTWGVFLQNFTSNALISTGAREGTVNDVFNIGAPRTPVALGQGADLVHQDSLPTMNQFDVFDFNLRGSVSNWSVFLVTGTASNFVPAIAAYTTSSGNFGDFVTQGWDVVIYPASGGGAVHRLMIDTLEPSTQAGFAYTLTIDTAGTPQAIAGTTGTNCAGIGTADFTTGMYFVTIDTTGGGSDMDPSSSSTTCSDPRASGGAVDGPGPDRVYRVDLAAGETLVAGAQSQSVDVVLYVVDAANCVAAPSACKAAADIFGEWATDTRLGTDSLRYTNTGSTTETVYFVLDDFNASSTGGSVNLFVDIR